jgi:hypothetical protein
LPMAGALKSAECSADSSTCDIIMGPGRGLQLKSKAHHPGRVLFCAHRTDPVTNRVSPIWSSDNGDNFTLRAVLPHGSLQNMSTFGPDECQLAELENGTIICAAASCHIRPSPTRPSSLTAHCTFATWSQTMRGITGSEIPGGGELTHCLGTAVSTVSSQKVQTGATPGQASLSTPCCRITPTAGGFRCTIHAPNTSSLRD